MALEAGSPATSFTPQVVANAFVKQYYQTLRYARQDSYKFYNDSSILGRADSNGKMMNVTTIDDIKEQLMSTDFADCLIEIETVDAQPSHVDGVLILVAGYFTTDAVKQKFTQSFFLAPQENRGYYVLNDMFRLTRISTEVKEVVVNHDNKSTQITTLPNDEVVSTSANVVPPVKNDDPVVETCVKVVNKDVEKVPEASTPLTAEKAVNKDLVKIAEAAPAPRAPVEKAAPAPRSPVEKAAPAPRAPVEKAAPAPRAPVEKAAPAPPAPVEKAAPAPPAPVEKAAPAPVEKAAPAPPAPIEKAAPTPRAPVEKAAPAPPTPVEKSAPAPPSSDEKEVTRKSYASIVKTMRESTQPAPAARPAKPNPRPKAAQNVSSPSIPAHATDNALPGDKSVPKNKATDEPGYSIFVKNLPFDATVKMVEQEFSKFGAIKSGGIQVKCQPDQFCFGFVEFEAQQSMVAAIEASTVYFGTREAYVEEKRTKTRVVDGVITRGDDNGHGFQSGRGGYYGDSYKRQWGGQNNGYYHNGDNTRNDYPGRVRGPQGNGYHQNGNGYHQNRNGYQQNGNGYSGNGYQQRRPSNNNGNSNGRVERNNGPRQQQGQGPAAA